MPKPRSKKPTQRTKHPSPTGAIVTGTAPCTCGHAPEEHGRDPAYPGSTACRECEDCVVYEADPEATRP